MSPLHAREEPHPAADRARLHNDVLVNKADNAMIAYDDSGNDTIGAGDICDERGYITVVNCERLRN